MSVLGVSPGLPSMRRVEHKVTIRVLFVFSGVRVGSREDMSGAQRYTGRRPVPCRSSSRRQGPPPGPGPRGRLLVLGDPHPLDDSGESPKLEFRSHFSLPRRQSETENCVAHNGALIPVPGGDFLVRSWWQGGVPMSDPSDPGRPRRSPTSIAARGTRAGSPPPVRGRPATTTVTCTPPISNRDSMSCAWPTNAHGGGGERHGRVRPAVPAHPRPGLSPPRHHTRRPGHAPCTRAAVLVLRQMWGLSGLWHICVENKVSFVPPYAF